MSVTMRCPNPSCERINRFDETLADRPVRCPVCRERFTLIAVGSTEAVPSGDGPVPPGGPETIELTTLAEGAHSHGASRAIEAMPSQVGRYEIKRTVGAGAFGAVYLAYDPQLDRDVALKVPHSGVLETHGAVERFLREARASARLRHGHIVPVYDAGHDGHRHFIASAYIPGSTLADVIGSGPLPFRRAAELVGDLAEALEHAHEHGVVHRDVKPSNVLIDASGTVLLADFGLAQHRGASDPTVTEIGTVMGTAGYMAPEVAAGIRGEVPPASDQYSLGVVLYELLCGRRPFFGPSHKVIYQKLEEDPPPPRAICPSLPPALDSICLRALAREADDRFPSCGALAAALRQWLDRGDEPPAPCCDPVSPDATQELAHPIPIASTSDIGVRPRRSRLRLRLPRLPEPLRSIAISLSIYGLIILVVIVLIRWLLAGA